MSKLFIGLFFGICTVTDPPVDVIEEKVDLVEMNHYYDESGKHIFDQILFYDWSDTSLHFNVRAYRLLKRQGQTPIEDMSSRYLSVWQDGSLIRSVTANQRVETWTQFDPELIERGLLPKNRRLELATPPGAGILR